MPDKAIVNGKAVLPGGACECSIVMGEEGRIKAILDPASPINSAECEIVDAKDCIIFPGGIDAHVHLVDGYDDMPVHPADNCYTGTMAALAGGTTTIVDFVCSSQEKKESPKEIIVRRKEQASNCVADYAFRYTFTQRYEQELKELDIIVKEGITSFKVFTYYDDTLLDRGAIGEIMESVKDIGVIKIHSEAPDIIDIMEKRADGRGDKGIVQHSLTRPNIAELLSVRDMIALHKLTGAKICIAHTSAGETLAEKEKEILQGDSFFVETCPHYMEFTRDRMCGKDGELYTMAPPLRSRNDADALWEGALNGTVDFIATDHCPFLKSEKWACDGNYHNVPYGVDGIQSRMHYMFSEGVMKRGMPLERFANLTAANPAKLYNMYPQKGCIAPGSDADLVIIDPNEKWIYTNKDIVGDCDYSVYDGMEFQGRIKKVFSRGELVYDNGRVNAKKGRGKFVACK